MGRFSSIARPTSLTADVGPSDTVLFVGSTEGWPVPDPGQLAHAQLGETPDRPTDDPSFEVVAYQSLTANSLVLPSNGRARSGTNTRSHPENTIVRHVVVAEDLERAVSATRATRMFTLLPGDPNPSNLRRGDVVVDAR